MNKRQYCATCHYPQSVCICDAVTSVAFNKELIIIQDPSEASHAKNTARLLPLCLPQVSIYQGLAETELAMLKSRVTAAPDDYLVVYPNPASEPLERITNLDAATKLIFIDATWRRAYKIWQSNPWLHSCRSMHFQSPPKTSYQIRKTSVENGLSTLDAVAYALHTLHNIDTSPLTEVCLAMQKKQLAFKP